MLGSGGVCRLLHVFVVVASLARRRRSSRPWRRIRSAPPSAAAAAAAIKQSNCQLCPISSAISGGRPVGGSAVRLSEFCLEVPELF